MDNPAIANLVKSSLESLNELKWIHYEKTTDVKPTQIDNVYCDDYTKTLVLLGRDEECTPTLVSEFARIYSLSTHKYNNNNNDNNFRRYKKWLKKRNQLIRGFTKSKDGNYYMIAEKRFYQYYSRYGFCSTCGILRCSPVWCICGYKQLSDGWTSNNHQLDDFIKKSQLQTNSPNDAYLEWIPGDCIDYKGDGSGYLYYGLPIPTDKRVRLIPLEITDETHDLYYAELCDKHPDILTTDVWFTIGFTYHEWKKKYYLIKEYHGHGLCLACTERLEPKINAFCYWCKAPRPLDWTTGNKTLDSFIMQSWSNTTDVNDAYIQWIEYSTLMNVREMTSLRHGCTHVAEWLEQTVMKVMLKRMIDEQNDRSFDLYQLPKEYPTILTPDNIWIIGITQEPSTREYYLAFYYDVYAILDRFIQNNDNIKHMQYSDFDSPKKIGSGGYGTVYTAKYKKYSEVPDMQQTVVLKRLKDIDETPDLFISEFRNHAKCARGEFLKIYGVTRDPETNEYTIVMQYANNGSLLSYLDQNINNLTWKMKLERLYDIAGYLCDIHSVGLVHCDLHGGNIVMHNDAREIKSLICDLGLSRSVNSRESNSTIRGVLPFVAPEVFHTCQFTQKSDIYAFGIIMYLMATGEPPFRDRKFDSSLTHDIMDGLRPTMPDSAPEEYKKLVEQCCDADPDKRPDAYRLYNCLMMLINSSSSNSDVWNAVYHNDVEPLSRLEKESKYSSTLLPTGGLPKPRNSSSQLPPLSDFSLPILEEELMKVDEE